MTNQLGLPPIDTDTVTLSLRLLFALVREKQAAERKTQDKKRGEIELLPL